ncbi:MAG: S8 family serine peptidase, partial [Haliea sp.]|uniref:S8 family serine peptidase n=1 Tax=Haliea sp. TaxID=1932666 RepID=UPI0032EB926B
MKATRNAAVHFHRLAIPALLAAALVASFPAWSQGPGAGGAATAAPPSLQALRQDCEKLWREGLAYVEKDLSELLRDIGEDRSHWLPHNRKRVQELTEELVSIRATLAYCEATFTSTDKKPRPDGILGPVSMPDWGNAGNTPGASDIDFSMLFVSTRCELCRKQVREMNDWILSHLKPTMIRNYLWGRFAAPGEAQEIAVRRTTHGEEDTALFQQQYGERLAALRNCEDLYCANRDEDGPATDGSPAMPSDTATRATPTKEPYNYFTDKTHCLHPDCLFLAEQLAQRNPVYTDLMDTIISLEAQLAKAGATLKNCSDCQAAEISRLIRVRDSIYRDLATIRARRLPLWTEMVNLDADLRECEKKWCSRSSIHYDPRYEIGGGRGYRSLPHLVQEALLGGPGRKALPESTEAEEGGWGEFSPSFKYTLPGRAFSTREDPPRMTYPAGANGAAVFDREKKPSPEGKAEPAVPRSSQQPSPTASAGSHSPYGRLLIGLDSARMAQLAARQPGEVLVAVIDSGADFSHPDLAAALWHNPGERYNYRDDDGNGLIDDISGWNYIAHNAVTQDDNGHGTLVAGIIASRGDANDSMAGVNPWARILPLKATNRRGDGNSVGVAAAITEAVNRGARVINVSLGGEQFAAAEETAVRYAHDGGALVVVAAGNQNSDTQAFWPAGLDNVITVAALDAHGERAAFSNWGSAVDIAAPGS